LGTFTLYGGPSVGSLVGTVSFASSVAGKSDLRGSVGAARRHRGTRVEISNAEIGFPELDGYTMQAHLELHPSGSIMLWFYKYVRNLNSIVNLHVFLIDAHMTRADVEIAPSFPDMKSYSVMEALADGRKLKMLDIIFERGNLAFSFQKSFYFERTALVGSSPDELNNQEA
jgi:hypothetical protein